MHVQKFKAHVKVFSDILGKEQCGVNDLMGEMQRAQGRMATRGDV